MQKFNCFKILTKIFIRVAQLNTHVKKDVYNFTKIKWASIISTNYRTYYRQVPLYRKNYCVRSKNAENCKNHRKSRFEWRVTIQSSSSHRELHHSARNLSSHLLFYRETKRMDKYNLIIFIAVFCHKSRWFCDFSYHFGLLESWFHFSPFSAVQGEIYCCVLSGISFMFQLLRFGMIKLK